MGKKILVADDSPTIRKMVESLLKKQGHDILCAEDGAVAAGMAKANKPDLILWDNSLPVSDGHRACKELKGNDELRSTPLIILLTKDQRNKEEELRRIGADAFLVKPLYAKDVLEKARQFLKEGSVDLKEEVRDQPRHGLVHADEKSTKAGPEDSLSSIKEKERKDQSLDILETSEFLESLQAPSSASDEADYHGFDWFMSELKKELEETRQTDLGTEQKEKEKLGFTKRASWTKEGLGKQGKHEKKDRVYQIDKDQRGYEDLLRELKKELRQPGVDESSDQKVAPEDYDKVLRDLIERIATKIAQEVVARIEPEILKQILRDEVERLREKEA